MKPMTAALLLACLATQPPPPAAPPAEINGTILYNTFHGNLAAADAKYLDKVLSVTLAAHKVGKDSKGRYYVSQFGTATRRYPPGLICYLKPDQVKRAGELKGDDVIVIVGKCKGRRDDRVYRGAEGYEYVVELEDCEIK
jgi:hypothetical protein